MLILEIAAGVFVGGLALTWLLNSRKARQRAADARRVEDAVRQAVERYVSGPLEQKIARLLELYGGRLTTLEDDPDTHFLTAGTAEHGTFLENVVTLESATLEEINTHFLATELAFADKHDLGTEMRQLIRGLVGQRFSQLKNYSLGNMLTKVLEIDETNKKRNADILSAPMQRDKH